MELYVVPELNKLLSDIIITLEGPAGLDGERAKDKIIGSTFVEVELKSPVDSNGDGLINDPATAANNLTGNEFTFGSENSGILTLKLRALASPSGASEKIKDSCYFTVTAIGNSVMAWNSANPVGKPIANGDYLEATVTFTGLPTENAAFGSKVACLYFNGVVQDQAAYEVFYNKTNKNHPGIDNGDSPNWFYYWHQTPARNGDNVKFLNVGGFAGGVPAMILWAPTMNFGKTDIVVGDPAALSLNRMGDPTKKATGIDCFANTVKHEHMHTIQIADADLCLGSLNGKSKSLWEKGWSWNTDQVSSSPSWWNHITLGTDGKPGIADYDDDGDGVKDEDNDQSELDFSGANDVNLDTNSDDVPDAWAPYGIEEKARAQENIVNDTFLHYDWGSPGKQHASEKYDD